MSEKIVLECLVCGGGLTTKKIEENKRFPRYYSFCTECGIFEYNFESSNELDQCRWDIEAFGEKWSLINTDSLESVETFFNSVEEEIDEILMEKEIDSKLEYYEVNSIDELKMLLSSLMEEYPDEENEESEENECKQEEPEVMKENTNQYAFRIIPRFLISDTVNLKIPVKKTYQTELFKMVECSCCKINVHSKTPCEECGGAKIKIVPHIQEEVVEYKDSVGEILSIITTITKNNIEYQYELLVGDSEPLLFSEEELHKWN